MNSIKTTKVEVEADLGAGLRKCLIDSIELSVVDQVNVQLLHNDKVYRVDIEELIKLVEKPLTL